MSTNTVELLPVEVVTTVQSTQALIPAVVAVSESLVRSGEVERWEIAVTQLGTEVTRGRFEITTAEQYRRGGQMREELADAKRRWTSFWDPMIKPAHLVHTMLCDARNKLDKPLKALLERLEGKMRRYVIEQDRIKAEQDAELQRQAEVMKRETEKQAEAAMLRGEVGKAKQLAEAAQNVVAPVLPDSTPKLDDTQVKYVWEVRVTDKIAFLRAITRREVPDTMVDVNLSAIKKMAEQHDGLNWPGIEVKKVPQFATRR